jgi:hypothetical protein
MDSTNWPDHAGTMTSEIQRQYEHVNDGVSPSTHQELAPSRQGVAQGLQMKSRNPAAAWILWPFLTLGIYHLVWYYKIHREMAEFDRRRQVPVAGPMLVILLLGWTVVAPLVSYYNTGNRIRNAQRAAGLPASCSGGIGLLLMFVFGLGVLYYQAELNKISHSYGEATPPGTTVPLYV